MANGEVCCLLGVCCPPEQQEEAIVRVLCNADVCDEATAHKVAKAMQPYLNVKAILKSIEKGLQPHA